MPLFTPELDTAAIAPAPQAMDSLTSQFSNALANPTLHNLLLTLASGIGTPARSTGELVGNTSKALLDFSLSNARQQQLNKVYQSQIDQITANTAEKQEKKATRAKLAKELKDPNKRRSDILLEAGEIKAGIKARELEDKQDTDAAEVLRQKSYLAQIFQEEEDPVIRSLFAMGEEGQATSLIRQRRGEQFRRERPPKPKSSEEGFGTALESLVQSVDVPDPDALPIEDPRIAAARQNANVLTEVAATNQTAGNLGRAATAVKEFEKIQATVQIEEEKEVKKAQTLKVKEEEKLQKEERKSQVVSEKGLKETVDPYIESFTDEGKFNLDDEDQALIKSAAPGLVRQLNKRGVPIEAAKRHVMNRIIFNKLRGQSVNESLLDPGPLPEHILELENSRNHPRYEELKQLFTDKYGYTLLY